MIPSCFQNVSRRSDPQTRPLHPLYRPRKVPRHDGFCDTWERSRRIPSIKSRRIDDVSEELPVRQTASRREAALEISEFLIDDGLQGCIIRGDGVIFKGHGFISTDFELGNRGGQLGSVEGLIGFVDCVLEIVVVGVQSG